jgi:tRNA(Ile)-lysidine synthetase, N-terminal domain/tRNA(Ile)-lysidine synthetase, C-terminal domain
MTCLAVLRDLGYDVTALHVNYGLREGADGDEALVREWCAKQSPPISLTVVERDPKARAERNDESLQEAARIQRYDAMAQEAEKREMSAVAVGHHRDDQAETLLLNLVRGTGPEGLAGMPPSRPFEAAPGVSLVRPLLDVGRDEIEALARARALPWREDPTNQDPAYDRSVIRTDIIPLLQKKFDGVPDTLARTAGLMRDYVDHTVTPALEVRRERCYTPCRAGGRLWLDAFETNQRCGASTHPGGLCRCAARGAQTAAVASEIDDLLDSQVGRRVEVGDGAVWRTRRGLRFLPNAVLPTPLRPPVSIQWGEDVSLERGVLRIDPLDAVPSSMDAEDPHVEYVDADRLAEPLTVGAWNEGDRLQPLGMTGTKPVGDCLREARVPPHRRGGVYLLRTAEHPAWVVGHRLDHRVRVRSSTERAARLSWSPAETASDDCPEADQPG